MQCHECIFIGNIIAQKCGGRVRLAFLHHSEDRIGLASSSDAQLDTAVEFQQIELPRLTMRIPSLLHHRTHLRRTLLRQSSPVHSQRAWFALDARAHAQGWVGLCARLRQRMQRALRRGHDAERSCRQQPLPTMRPPHLRQNTRSEQRLELARAPASDQYQACASVLHERIQRLYDTRIGTRLCGVDAKRSKRTIVVQHEYGELALLEPCEQRIDWFFGSLSIGHTRLSRMPMLSTSRS